MLAGSQEANTQAFSTARGQTVLGSRSQLIRIRLPSPPPGSAHLVLALVSWVPASTILPISEGPEVPSNQGSWSVISTAISRLQLMTLPSPHAYSGKGLADID